MYSVTERIQTNTERPTHTYAHTNTLAVKKILGIGDLSASIGQLEESQPIS